jgi:hypothetical protein
MWRDLSGPSRRIAAVALGGVLVAALAGCGAEGSVPIAEGADVGRPPSPSMDLVTFEDVAAEVGLTFEHGAFRWGTSADPAAMMGGGLCWIDYDRDGWLDLFVTNTWSNGEWGRWRQLGALPTSKLFRNEVGRFVDVTDTTSAGLETRAHGCVAADLDLDGWTDLYVTTDRENVLLWNDGGKGFVDGSTEAGVGTFGWHSGAAVGDVDGNGWPDLFVAGYADVNRRVPSATKGFPNTFEPVSDLLFLNQGPDGGSRVRFREAAADVGLEPDGPDYGLGAVMSDFDGDGDLDLYVANDTTPNQLYENVSRADGFEFVEVGAAAGVDDDGAGMGVASGDADFDGRADLVVTNQLQERHGAWWNAAAGGGLRFEDARPSMGQLELGGGATGWGTSWADFDLDTDLDLFLVHGAIPVRDLRQDREFAQLLENGFAGGGEPVFTDVSAMVGLGTAGPFLGRGAAVADYDNDGDLDVAIATIGGPIVLLRNTGAGGHWLIVDPMAPAPGAVVTIELADGTSLRRELIAGSSYLSSEDPRAHFGLGTAEVVASVTVVWPDGSRRTHTDVDADQILSVGAEARRG